MPATRKELSKIWTEHPRASNRIRCKVCSQLDKEYYSWISRNARASHENSGKHRLLLHQFLQQQAAKSQRRNLTTINQPFHPQGSDQHEKHNDDAMDIDACSDIKTERRLSCDSLDSVQCEQGSVIDPDWHPEEWDLESDFLKYLNDPMVASDLALEKGCDVKELDWLRPYNNDGLDQGDPLQSPEFIEMLRNSGLI